MRTYKLHNGSHAEHGRMYKAGDTFESPDDLRKMFPGKFSGTEK